VRADGGHFKTTFLLPIAAARCVSLSDDGRDTETPDVSIVCPSVPGLKCIGARKQKRPRSRINKLAFLKKTKW